MIPNFNISSIQNGLNVPVNNNTSSTATNQPIQGNFVNATQSSKPNTNDSQFEIQGNGRCLSFDYKQQNNSQKFKGTDCASNQPFLCKLTSDHINNEISRIAKSMGIIKSED